VGRGGLPKAGEPRDKGYRSSYLVWEAIDITHSDRRKENKNVEPTGGSFKRRPKKEGIGGRAGRCPEAQNTKEDRGEELSTEDGRQGPKDKTQYQPRFCWFPRGLPKKRKILMAKPHSETVKRGKVPEKLMRGRGKLPKTVLAERLRRIEKEKFEKRAWKGLKAQTQTSVSGEIPRRKL